MIKTSDMAKSNLPKSVRQCIRKEKARLRREISGTKEQENLINALYIKFSKRINGEDKKS